jgi:hypothetical protein
MNASQDLPAVDDATKKAEAIARSRPVRYRPSAIIKANESGKRLKLLEYAAAHALASRV